MIFPCGADGSPIPGGRFANRQHPALKFDGMWSIKANEPISGFLDFSGGLGMEHTTIIGLIGLVVGRLCSAWAVAAIARGL
jgi:hypothetical protein